MIRESVKLEYSPIVIGVSKLFAKQLVDLDDITIESILLGLKESRPNLHKLVCTPNSRGYMWLNKNIDDMKKFMCE